MQIFNTLTRSLETFEPREPGRVGIYVCGATVQSRPHLGHGRYAVVFDVIRRYLEWSGYEVTYVENVTDVDDKIIAMAAERGQSIEEVVKDASEAFNASFAALGIRPADIEPHATQHIPQMVSMIEAIIDKGHAYESDGDVYFSVRSFDRYGQLSGRNIDELRSGARVEPDERKRDPLDFALWKAAKPGEPKWDSPWGPGRPGWHIECSAMSEEYLGFGFDIHGGGNDLVFPHHENELAQAEAARENHPYVRYWLHNGMMNLGGEKMSKSTGHIIDLLHALEQHPPLAVRLFYLRTHYRKPLDFSQAALEDAAASLERLWAFRRRREGPIEDESDAATLDRFRLHMDDDLDAAGALGVLFDTVREGNRLLDAGEGAGPLLAAYDEMIGVFGLAEPVISLDDLSSDLAGLAEEFGLDPGSPESVVDRLVERRQTARSDKDFAAADRIRDRMAELGIIIEDTPGGARWHRG